MLLLIINISGINRFPHGVWCPQEATGVCNVYLFAIIYGFYYLCNNREILRDCIWYSFFDTKHKSEISDAQDNIRKLKKTTL